MNDESLEQIERQIALASPVGALRELRSAVLGDVHRELRAAKWDRRLARAAVVLLVVGVGMNVGIGKFSGRASDGARLPIARTDSRQSLVDTAIVVTEATDAATGSRLWRQLAAMAGRTLTREESAAIDAAVRKGPPQRGADGSRG